MGLTMSDSKVGVNSAGAFSFIWLFVLLKEVSRRESKEVWSSKRGLLGFSLISEIDELKGISSSNVGKSSYSKRGLLFDW